MKIGSGSGLRTVLMEEFEERCLNQVILDITGGTVEKVWLIHRTKGMSSGWTVVNKWKKYLEVEINAKECSEIVEEVLMLYWWKYKKRFVSNEFNVGIVYERECEHWRD